MKIDIEHKCRDLGEKGCLGEPDPQYTMNWDDIGEEPIYWCSACGPDAQHLDMLIQELVKQPGGAERLSKAMDEIEAEHGPGRLKS